MWTIFPYPCSVFARYFANRWVIVQRQVAGHILCNGRKTAQINLFSEEKNVEIVGNFNMNTRHPNTGLRLRLFGRGQAGKKPIRMKNLGKNQSWNSYLALLHACNIFFKVDKTTNPQIRGEFLKVRVCNSCLLSLGNWIYCPTLFCWRATQVKPSNWLIAYAYAYGI